MFVEPFSLISLQRAYRKYKSMVYYDTFGAKEREKLAEFEDEHNIQDNNEYFIELSKRLQNQEERENTFRNIESKIAVCCYPKTIKKVAIEEQKQKPISNEIPLNHTIDKVQYHIELPVEGHILGIVWVLYYGVYFDESLIEQCFGNRLKSYIYKEKNKITTISPFLFEPYFRKYESWRDGALDVAQRQLGLKNDVLLITLDIQSYYYSARIDFEEIKRILESRVTDEEEKWCEICTGFVERIFKSYTKMFAFSEGKAQADNLVKSRPFIPIGFAPSQIIANWYLDEFDRQILSELHPIYYGRYVDDFLMVLPYYESEVGSAEKSEEFIDRYFTQKGLLPKHNLFCKKEVTVTLDGKEEKRVEYTFQKYKYSGLKIQMEKFKIYLFRHNASQTMLDKFRREIRSNSSEFRFLAETDFLAKHVEDRIYKIDYSDTVNKWRSVDGIGVDKFKLSKTLSSLLYASLEHSYDKHEEMFGVIKKLFVDGFAVELFTQWEKALLLLFMHKRYEECKELVISFIKSIDQVEFEPNREIIFSLRNGGEKQLLQKTLLEMLKSSMWRVFTLRNNSDVTKLFAEMPSELMIGEDIQGQCKKYVQSHLIDNKLTRFPIHRGVSRENEYDLIFDDERRHGRREDEKNIRYYPRFIHLHECFLYQIAQKIQGLRGNARPEQEWIRGIDYFKESLRLYRILNYDDEMIDEGCDFFEVETCPCEEENGVYAQGNGKKCKQYQKSESCRRYADWVRVNKIKIGKEYLTKLRIGMASVQVKDDFIEAALSERPKKSVKRMEELVNIVNKAVEEEVNILVLPECYVPFSWAGTIIEAARKHNMAMVFGVEHIVQAKTAYNYLLTALPVRVDDYNNCVVKMRLKNFYSPKEKQWIQNYRLHCPSNPCEEEPMREYDLFSWNHVDFAAYNCFELSHIVDRALFKSEIDLLIACEDNKDVAYFDDIIDSLALDLHCYCIQVNSSHYGNSKIAQPKKSYEKTAVSIKGGENVFLVVGEVDIHALREFQLSGGASKDFKPLPPGFSIAKVRRRLGLS